MWKGCQALLTHSFPIPFKMATSSIFRTNYPLLVSFLFEKGKIISAIVSESRDQRNHSPVQVVVLTYEIEESSSAKAPRIQLERVGSPVPVEP
jgi:hypothetical protein